MMRRQPRHKAPLFKYSYCSLSNILSSWCQYEALKYISFPTQVLAKASKIIPVMLMGKVVSKRKYEYYEYVVAVLITVGMVAFLLDCLVLSICSAVGQLFIYHTISTFGPVIF